MGEQFGRLLAKLQKHQRGGVMICDLRWLRDIEAINNRRRLMAEQSGRDGESSRRLIADAPHQ
jgi:hypothetical protein